MRELSETKAEEGLSGVLKGGLRFARRVLRRAPDCLRFAELADACRRAGALAEATTICARGLLRYPNYATGQVVMGEIFWARGLHDQAREHWQEALRLDARHPRAHFRLAELYLALGARDRAVTEAEAALLSDPGFAEARELLWQAREEAPGRLSPVGDEPWFPSQSPHLRSPISRLEALLAEVLQSPAVEGALLADADGLPLAGNLTQASGRSPGSSEMGAAVSGALTREARRLLSCLQAGELKAVLLRGRSGVVRCVSLPGATLIAELNPTAPLGAAEAEIAEALVKLKYRGDSDEHANRLPAAA